MAKNINSRFEGTVFTGIMTEKEHLKFANIDTILVKNKKGNLLYTFKKVEQQ